MVAGGRHNMATAVPVGRAEEVREHRGAKGGGAGEGKQNCICVCVCIFCVCIFCVTRRAHQIVKSSLLSFLFTHEGGFPKASPSRPVVFFFKSDDRMKMNESLRRNSLVW